MAESPNRKQYVVDTNILIENPKSILALKNGEDNDVLIPFHVLMELDKLKTNPQLRHIVTQVIELLMENRDRVRFLPEVPDSPLLDEHADSHILREVTREIARRSEAGNTEEPEPVLVTNDRILQLRAHVAGVKSEELRDSRPFESESQLYTGFVEEHEPRVPNCFVWRDGRPIFFGPEGEKPIGYSHEIWGVRPRNVYQNLAMELMTQDGVDLISVQSEAGYGKTFLALAAALYLTLEKRRFEKIYLVKPTIEIGVKLGYLPGDIEEKLEPYMKYVRELALKLHSMRPANKLFLNPGDDGSRFNPKKMEILPLNYIRGMNIENAIVIIDETQNLSRAEVRALLTRMGEGVKCLCLGDTSQVDNPHLNAANNGLNWIVKKFKGFANYAHIVLRGEKSRGPITDMVLKSRL